MLMAEYDYEMDIAVQRQESWEDGMEEGRIEGEKLILLKQVIKKLQKSYSPERIADEIEEPEERIRNLCELLKPYAPEYDEEKIENELSKTDW